MFRNLILYQLPGPATPSPADFDAAIADAGPIRDPGPLELASFGWRPPLPGRDSTDLVRRIGLDVLLSFGTCARILPAQVVNDAVAEKLDALEAQRGRRPGGKERQRIKDEVITDLMPRAFLKHTRTLAWFDHGNGILAIDTASRKTAEVVVSALRAALGSFPATPLSAMSSCRLILTEWLTGEGLPDEVTLGEECELRDPGDDGAIVRVRRQDLGAEEVREHVNAGKQATALQVGYDGRVSFVLCEDLSLRKLRFDDVVTDQLGDVAGEDATAELDARFALMTGELRRLFSFLAEHFDVDHSTLKLDGGQAPPDGPAEARQAVDRLRKMAAEDGIGITIEGNDGEKFEIAPVPVGPRRQGRTRGKGAPA